MKTLRLPALLLLCALLLAAPARAQEAAPRSVVLLPAAPAHAAEVPAPLTTRREVAAALAHPATLPLPAAGAPRAAAAPEDRKWLFVAAGVLVASGLLVAVLVGNGNGGGGDADGDDFPLPPGRP